MKVLALGDSHFDEHGPRLDECVRVHEWIADLVERERPDLVVHTGDVYERASTPKERLAASAFFQRVAVTCPVVIVRGNHDAIHDLELLGELRTKCSLRVTEACGVLHFGALAVGCVAWPSRASALDENGVRDNLRGILRGLQTQMDGFPRRLLVGHFMVDGCVTSVGQPMIGGALNVPFSDFALAGAQAVLCGHIHKPQDWVHDGSPIIYTGSPYRTAFGETEEKSVVMLEWDAENRVTWKRVATPARHMHLVTAKYAETSVGHVFQLLEPVPVAPYVDGSEIRLRYTVDSDRRAEAKREAEAFRSAWLAAGALSVKVEAEVQTSIRARAPEVAAARTLPEKLGALWTSRSDTPAPVRADRLMTKLTQLEEEASL